MGKVNKRKPLRHTNHHDNPRRLHKTVVRRHHSQPIVKPTKRLPAQPVGNIAPKPVGHNANQPTKPRVPFSRVDQVLLVGEGDFSFALSLARNYRPSAIVATCFDSEETLLQKYPRVSNTIAKLNKNPLPSRANDPLESSSVKDAELGWEGFSPVSLGDEDQYDSTDIDASTQSSRVSIQYAIDATKLSSAHRKSLKVYSPFTKIVFNFPHVGGLSTDVNRQVRANQKLLVDFFNSAKPLLATKPRPARSLPTEDSDEDQDYSSESERQQAEYLNHGQILVTLFEGEPYTLWNIRDLARHSGLKILESFRFPWSAFPGYQHARTIGDITTGKDRSDQGKRKGAWRGEERDARCYILALQEDDSGPPEPGSRKRKNQADEDDSD